MALGLYGTAVCLCGFIFILALDIMGFFNGKNHFDVDGKTVVITGGSQGMGRALAKLLAQKGANVVIVARNEAKLAEAFTYISSAAKNPAVQRFNAISADVTKGSENDRIIAEVTAWNHGKPPDVVWANAGSAHPGLLLDTSEEIMRKQMDLNYWAANSLARSTLKAWTTPSTGSATIAKSDTVEKRHFIMTSSVACFIGIAGYTAYAPAKAALRSLADTLRSELNLYNGMRRSKDPKVRAGAPDRDIAVHLIAPATIKSPGYEVEEQIKPQVTKELEKDDVAQTEDEVAVAAVERLEKGGFIITTQFTGDAMRAAMLGPSPRNNILMDTLFGFVAAFVWLFVTPDLEGKVFGYGKKYGPANVDEAAAKAAETKK